MNCDVAVVGGGAAGLAAAIFAARSSPDLSILVLEGAKKPGAKILVSGGGRCNVTNAVVTERDFFGGNPHIIRRVLRAFDAQETAAFFRGLGVALHEEAGGKLFPDTNRAQTVLDALLSEAARLGVRLLCGHRVTAVERAGDGFTVQTSMGTIATRRLILATGGKSLPKTGSDGGGYAFAEKLGHSLVPPTPALAPLLLDAQADGHFHEGIRGVTHEAEISVHVEGRKTERIRGSFLWTHFGVSGPAAMNASRLWERARLEGKEISVTVNLLPGEDAEKRLLALASEKPGAQVRNALAALVPARLAAALFHRLGVAPCVMAQFTKEARNKLARALAEFPLPVRGSRGYDFAEATAGGVPLSEINPATMESHLCPGLYLVGEILDVDGRIGGFNFQWAWSSGFVAGAAMAARRPA